MAGLSYKTWRMVSGEWFEGCYVFATTEAREEFQRTFTEGAAESRVEDHRLLADPDRGVRHRLDRRRLGRLQGRTPTPDLRLREPTPSWRPAVRHRQAAAPAPGLVRGDLAAELADRDRLVVALRGVGHPVVPQGVVEGHDPTGAQQSQRLLQVGGVLRACRRRRRPCRSGRRSAGGARRARRRRWCARAGWGCRPRRTSRLASRWCSASMSTVVSTPSARMPRSSQRPETPVPVPISTTARASRTEARKRSAAPLPSRPATHRPPRRGCGRRPGSRPRPRIPRRRSSSRA